MATLTKPINYDSLRHLLAPRAREGHKGNYGHALIVGGAPGFGGAALMAAEACARTGSGLTSVATHSDHAASFLSHRPELMVRGIDNFDVINVMMKKANVLIAGPGLGKSSWSVQLLQAAIQGACQLDIPVVLDADALNLLSEGQLSSYLKAKSKWILTPHQGEAARLLDTSVEQIEADREGAVRTLQANFGGVSVLKGPGTLICFEDSHTQQIEYCEHGNPGMASGGMGDVLSGIIGGLLAQGLSLVDSTRLGVCLHSKAADIATEQQGERGLLASDLFTPLRTLLNP